MPLIILGLLLIIGITIYWFVGNRSSDEPVTPRDLRERYARPFEDKARNVAKDVSSAVTKEIRRKAGIFDVDYDVEEDSDDEGDNTIPFPSDAEEAKRRRNIH